MPLATIASDTWHLVPGHKGSFRIEAPGAGQFGGTLMLAQRGTLYTATAYTAAASRLMTQAPRMLQLLRRLVDSETQADIAAVQREAFSLLFEMGGA
jgi:hypothetical protein